MRVAAVLASLLLCGRFKAQERQSSALGPDTESLIASVKSAVGQAYLSGDQFTQIRETLLRWIDTWIKQGKSQNEINRELRDAGLIDRRELPRDEVLKSFIGYLAEAKVQPLSGGEDILQVRLGIGMTCGYDETVVLYRRQPFARIGILNEFEPSHPIAQRYTSIVIGPRDSRGRRIVAAGAVSLWCTSTYVGAVLRLESLQDSCMRTLLKRAVAARIWDDAAVVRASVEGNVATFLYQASLPDGELMSRKAIARYSISGEQVRREPPIALSRIGFIDEWLMMDDREAVRWSTPNAAKRHRDLSAWVANKPFEYWKTWLCSGSPSRWEVVINPLKDPTERRVFLLAEAGANKMKMLKVSKESLSGCREMGLPGLAADLGWQLGQGR